MVADNIDQTWIAAGKGKNFADGVLFEDLASGSGNFQAVLDVLSGFSL